MKETRIIGGFSLVEMMLLLLIVSLMIASSVAVISKRHVKVPRIAMHGAYMCYYKNGNLHEERYVGANLTKKILDRDVTECSFTPPDRVSYLHIQATAGGGGGGDAGYTGGTIVNHKSATEVISPFGLTEEYVKDVKGLSTAGQADLWGNIHAYADGTGIKGDAGGGGDVWYINQECAGSYCLAKRKWENKQNGEKGCWNKTKTVSYPESKYQTEANYYDYNCQKDCGARDYGSPKSKTNCNAQCNAYEYYDYDIYTNNSDYVNCNSGYYEYNNCYAGMDVDDCDRTDCTPRYDSCAGKRQSGDCYYCTKDYDIESCVGEPYYTSSRTSCRYCDRSCAGRSYTALGCSGCTRQKDADGNNTNICASGKSTYCFSGTYQKYNGYCSGGTYNSGECKSGGTYYKRNSAGAKLCSYAFMRDYDRCGDDSTYWAVCNSRTTTPTAKNTGGSPPTSGKTSSKKYCLMEYNIPQDATTCTVGGYKKFQLDVEDTYQKDTNVDNDNDKYPSYMYVTTSPNAGYISARGTQPLIERKIARTEGEEYAVCNYGNPTLFNSGDGIFGSFFIGLDDVGVNCDSEALTEAFGEGIIKISDGKTGKVSTFNTEIPSSKHYDPKIEYDVSEDYEDNKPYGEVAESSTAGTWVSEDDVTYKNPFTGKQYKPEMSLPSTCNLTEDSWENHIKTQDISDCSTFKTYQGYGNVSGWKRIWRNWDKDSRKYKDKKVTYSSKCMDVKSTWQTYNPSSKSTEFDNEGNIKSGHDNSICMLNFDDYNNPKNETDSSLTDKNNGEYTKDRCSYVPRIVEGGEGGLGVSCTTGSVVGGIGLTYEGYGGILPGIRGSNYIAIQPNEEVKALYTEAEWKSQSSGYAQNGTDSVGYAKVTLSGGGECSIHESQIPTKGTGARKLGTGGTKPEAGVSSSQNGSKDGTDGGLKLGENQVGYMVDDKENYKYKYWYTWDTNYMQYGEGGEAGEYRAMIVRPAKGKEIRITLGRGGAGGAEGTGNNGDDGGDTIVGDILTVEGGKGGLGGQVTNTEQLPYWHEGGDFLKGQPGTDGKARTVTTIKANIMNLVLPIDNSILGQWITASGHGGNGGGSENRCWASEWVRNFEGQDDPQSIHAEDVACRQGEYWSSTPVATAGTDGLVLIRW